MRWPPGPGWTWLNLYLRTEAVRDLEHLADVYQTDARRMAETLLLAELRRRISATKADRVRR